jgi:molybdopterin synthase sulfur carrier subunit
MTNVTQVSETTVRWFGAARAAAGVPQEQYAAATLGELLREAVAVHGPDLARVLLGCSFLLDGIAVGERAHDAVVLADVDLVDALPPFAGG